MGVGKVSPGRSGSSKTAASKLLVNGCTMSLNWLHLVPRSGSPRDMCITFFEVAVACNWKPKPPLRRQHASNKRCRMRNKGDPNERTPILS